MHAAGGSRLAIIGDVHGCFGARDEGALEALHADIVCIVGDVGEENLQLVQLLSQLPLPKAAILGNHDGWWACKAPLSISQGHFAVGQGACITLAA